MKEKYFYSMSEDELFQKTKITRNGLKSKIAKKK